MCLYPKLIKNRKYVVNKKNGGNVPPVTDPRVLMVPVGCGKCIECRKQKARGWQVRLTEEIQTHKNGHFVTLSFTDQSLIQLQEELTGIEGYELENETATLAMRRFLERWRKKYKISVRHWAVTELGQTNTERIHIHAIIFTNNKHDIEKIWQYGDVYIGDYVSEQTVNYIIKYVHKIDPIHKEYNPKILTSKGIGAGYFKKLNAKGNQYNPGKTDERYTTRTGIKINLPIYFRNGIYTEDQKEKLWLEKLDKEERWVCGERVDISNGTKEYEDLVKYHRSKNKERGYGNDEKNWDRIRYENQQRKIKQQTRIAKLKRNVGPKVPPATHKKQQKFNSTKNELNEIIEKRKKEGNA